MQILFCIMTLVSCNHKSFLYEHYFFACVFNDSCLIIMSRYPISQIVIVKKYELYDFFRNRPVVFFLFYFMAKLFPFPEFSVDRSCGVCAAIIRLCRYARDCAKFFCKRRCITLNIVAKNLYYPLSPRWKLAPLLCRVGSHSVVIPSLLLAALRIERADQRWILLPPQLRQPASKIQRIPCCCCCCWISGTHSPRQLFTTPEAVSKAVASRAMQQHVLSLRLLDWMLNFQSMEKPSSTEYSWVMWDRGSVTDLRRSLLNTASWDACS